MKVRVLREMPFAKVGDIWEWNSSECKGFGLETIGLVTFWFSLGRIQQMVKDGWLEEVKEESLDDKIQDYMNKVGFSCHYKPSEVAQIANDHYLEVFDKCCNNKPIYDPTGKIVELRKALEDM